MLDFLLKTKSGRKLHTFLKATRNTVQCTLSFCGNYRFIDRSKGEKRLCIVLSGYKEFAYDGVFGRIKKYTEKDIDVCVLSSGIYSETLSDMCKENGWSYLSTSRNNVCLIQNIAIKLHPNAQYVYKLDEDIFITEGYFDNLLKAYNHAQQGDYRPGVMAPMILVNGYSHLLILKKLGIEAIYKNKFEKPVFAAGSDRQIENNPEVAKFMWGEGDYLPSIDQLNADCSKNPLKENACPVRFSIGAILFERDTWEKMRYLKVSLTGAGMGGDEEQICTFCCLNSMPMMISENIVVGHLSFGKQNQSMKQYYLEHKEKFIVSENELHNKKGQ